ncbi:predicted protein [Lichtheimia corymbifera JMRC:FSU:9682]|uniref:Uncharacterized protein n=1 Tax=Lichtheimia corymbifera JMRC:FSU:9682 TaxID=1263082 RepID=A0A068RQM2_9FUNG|nr:predicted protein [Lichtheimia corymbifera JMRC:FSU:9682]
MDGIKSSDEESWNVALVTWRVVGRNDHVDTAEDDDGVDGIDEMNHILAKGALQSWMLLEYSSQYMQQLFYNHGSRMLMTATIIPVDSM